jgi:hypothetical protein
VQAVRVFRGVKNPEEEVLTTGYKPDWRLIHKDEEEEVMKLDVPKRKPRIIAKDANYPPLLERMLMQEMNTTVPPKMEVSLRESVWNMYVREDRITEIPNLFPGHLDPSELDGYSNTTYNKKSETVSEDSS